MVTPRPHTYHSFKCLSVSTVSAPRSAKFCSCSVCARSSTACSSSSTRPPSTCSGSLSLTLLGGKVAFNKTRCYLLVKARITSRCLICALWWIFKLNKGHTWLPILLVSDSVLSWMRLMMLNFFPHLIDHGEWKLKTKPVWSETTFNDGIKYWTVQHLNYWQSVHI